MRFGLVAVVAIGVLAVGGRATADDIPDCDLTHPETCQTPDPLPPAPPTPAAPQPADDDPPRPPVSAMHHPVSTGPGTDRRPCVSKREYRGARSGRTRDEVEGPWEVTSLGKRRVVVVIGTAIVYPRCGYSADEAFYAVQYEDGKARIYAAWKDSGATLHGRP